MVVFLNSYARNTWNLVAEMAPYLIFGFGVAGLLHRLIRQETVQRLLGKPGLGAVVKASLLGVPMPLCSCSVIPVAASLRKSGASKGATASFLSSTPQTGVDSILATYALMGGIFTLVRVIVAFVCGLVAGSLVELFSKNGDGKPQPSAAPASFTAFKPSSSGPLRPSAPSPDFASLPRLTPSPQTPVATAPEPSIRNALRHGLITLPADLAVSLLTGLLLAGLITTLLPEHWLSGSLSTGWLAFGMATAISLPLYVCATASIPMAFALMAAGLSPGAALVFLIVGPATNTATVIAVWNMLGRKATLIYIASLVALSWLAGGIFNASFSAQTINEVKLHHESSQLAPWQHASAIVLIALIAFAYWKVKRPGKKKSCCCAT